MKQGNRCIRLAIFATHPIQYQAPWFRAIGAQPGLEVQVYYAMVPDAAQQGEGFGVDFKWDLPLLEGYQWQLLENRAAIPSLELFRGCDVRNIVDVMANAKPDVALITGWNSLFLLQALWACRGLGIPTLVRGDSNVLAPRGLLKTWAQRLLIHQFSAFLAVGELNRRLYEKTGIASERIFSCPHFVDNERFSDQASDLRTQRVQFRQRWGVPTGATCFLFVGKLVPKKRVIDFLRAVAEVSRKDPSICGLAVGAGELETEARAFVELKQLPVTFAGFLNQSVIAAAYVAADCLVLPSDYSETWGLVVNEAMACGVPAIVSDQVGCGSDLVTGGETGAQFPMGDVGGLAEMMVLLARDPEMLKVMGDVARRRVNTQYTVDRAVEGTTDAIEWVLKRRGPT